jgi:ethanolamine ammonia-lyase large subunit
MQRRHFLTSLAAGSAALTLGETEALRPVMPLPPSRADEDIFAFLTRTTGGFDRTRYAQILGAANPLKEGDRTIDVAAASEADREQARALLTATRLGDIDAHPLIADELHGLIVHSLDRETQARTAAWTLGELRDLLLGGSEDAIRRVMPGLSSEVIGCVVKLMSNVELTAVSATVHNALPGSAIGARGHLGARVQPNSPTDHPDDIRWQVFDAFAYGVGDVLLGTNPVSSEMASVAEVQTTLQEVIDTFGLGDVLPHCVLAHIDVQAEVERAYPGRTALWFQSLAGSDAANRTFDVSVEKMLAHADARDGRYGLYFETGQGADFTNGHAQGVDMVLHESRKYGFARALTQRVAQAQAAAGKVEAPWVHVNDVAGFIGPEVFRTREQLVRCCLEDLMMGKLHGLTIGLDVCATLHMDVGPDDLDWCLDQVAPASPAYLMALPTKVDPMLGYLTTGYQDHVRLRGMTGARVNPPMQTFFESLGVLRADGSPGRHFGDPMQVYVAYRRRKGDVRTDVELREEGAAEIAAVRSRGVFIAEGYGIRPHELAPELDTSIRRITKTAKQAFWAELTPAFLTSIPAAVPLETLSRDREEYILRPETGEELSSPSTSRIGSLRARHAGKYDVQLVVSDGLNALAVQMPGQLDELLSTLRTELSTAGWSVAPDVAVIRSGRVRAGYRVGEALFGGISGVRALLHVVGERPGTGHDTLSVYLTAVDGTTWGETGRVDHDVTRVVSGIAYTAQLPRDAARAVSRVLGPHA